MKEIEINKIELPDIELEDTTDEEAREYMDSKLDGKFDLKDWEELKIVNVIDYPLHYVISYKCDYYEKKFTNAFYYKNIEDAMGTISSKKFLNFRMLREDIKNVLNNELIEFYCIAEDIDGFKRKMLDKVDPQSLVKKLEEKYTLEQFEQKINEYKIEKERIKEEKLKDKLEEETGWRTHQGYSSGYDYDATKTHVCNCGSKEFRVGIGSYLTVVKCLKCGVEEVVHDG